MSLRTVKNFPRKNRPLQAALTAIAAWSLLSAPATAGQLIYTPVNPSFGGNPLNGPYMLQSAQAQKRYPYPLDDLNPTANSDLKILNAGEYPIIQVGTSVYIYDPGKGRWIPFDPSSVQAGTSLETTSSSTSTGTSATSSSGIDSGVLQ
jgi:curli production assembly/transport component CsgF